jgi:hypothetical protein
MARQTPRRDFPPTPMYINCSPVAPDEFLSVDPTRNERCLLTETSRVSILQKAFKSNRVICLHFITLTLLQQLLWSNMSEAPSTPGRSQSHIRLSRLRSSPSRNDTQDRMETQETITSTLNNRNLAIQEEVVATFLKRIVNCRSVPQLVSFVPAIVHERTKVALDEIISAHVKQAQACQLLAEWKDYLAKEDFKSVLQLKSLRAPSLQISKLAEKDGSISANFDESLKEAKRTALERMIEIKEIEVKALRGLCNIKNQADALRNQWNLASRADGVSPEAAALLYEPLCSLSLVQSTVSIGENTADKQMKLKLKKSEAIKKTHTSATDVMPKDKRGLEEFVKAIAQRQRQSALDKAKAKKSGKGRRGAGPSKTKNQKKNPNNIVLGQKDRKRKNEKRGPSSKRQQKKR